MGDYDCQIAETKVRASDYLAGTHAVGERVTVGMPFSQEPFDILERAVRSVFAQTHADWQLLLVGDAPSAENVSQLRAIKDPRVTVVVNSNRAGLATRLNDIAALAETRLLARMDADDIMMPRRLAVQIQHMQGEANVVGSRAVAIDARNRVLGVLEEPCLPQTPAGFLKSHALTHPTVMGETSWFKRNPYRTDLKRAEDKELWLRTAGATKFRKTSDTVLFYRVRRPSIHVHARDARYDRLVIREYGPELVGKFQTATLITRSHIKQRAHTAMILGGMSERIYRRKFAPLDPGSPASDLLESAVSASVPGWRDVW